MADLATVDATMKSQTVRVLDVVLIGPLMVAGGVALYQRSPFFGALLGFFGVSTVIYNGCNWAVVRKHLV